MRSIAEVLIAGCHEFVAGITICLAIDSLLKILLQQLARREESSPGHAVTSSRCPSADKSVLSKAKVRTPSK